MTETEWANLCRRQTDKIKELQGRLDKALALIAKLQEDK